MTVSSAAPVQCGRPDDGHRRPVHALQRAERDGELLPGAGAEDGLGEADQVTNGGAGHDDLCQCRQLTGRPATPDGERCTTNYVLVIWPLKLIIYLRTVAAP
jgi:hypothetical protein